MDNLANLMGNRATAWITTAQGFARHIFYGLAALEVTWAGIEYTLRKNELGDLLVSILFKLVAVCFFYFVLINLAPNWVPLIIQSFTQMGSTVSGTAIDQLSPSAVFEHGIVLSGALFNRAGQGNFITEVAGILESLPAMLILMFSFAFVALKLLITLAEADIVLAGALPMLGFLGSRWTTPWGEKYFGYAVSVGVKLLVLYLVVGLGDQIFMDEQNFFSGGSGPPTFADMYQYALAAFLYAGIAWSVPSIAGAIMTGTPALGVGSLIAPLATAAAGTLGAAAAGAAVAQGTAAAARSGLERLSALSSPAATPYVGPVNGTQKLASIGSRTESANVGSVPSTSILAAADSPIGSTGATSAADAATSSGSFQGNKSDAPTSGPSTDVAVAPTASSANVSQAANGSLDTIGAPSTGTGVAGRAKIPLRATARWRAAQEAGGRFQRYASSLARTVEHMPHTYGGLSIRIRHPEE
jgi:type IV secretion system protein TrbL